MALIKRGDKHYLIRSIARIDAIDRRAERKHGRAMERIRQQAERNEQERREQAERNEGRVKGLADEAKELATGAMLAAGFHRHRWAWRKKRDSDMSKNAIIEAEFAKAMKLILAEYVAEHGPLQEQTPEEKERIRAEIAFNRSPAGISAIIDRHESYDRTRADGAPSVVESLANLMGADPTRVIVEDLIGRWSDQDEARELLRRQYRRELAELCGPNPTVIERRLAERTMVCWLDLHVSERLAIRLHDDLNFTPAERGYFDKARDRAHNRYINTLRCLSLVRNRALPAFRVSLAVRGGKGGVEAAAMVESADGGNHAIADRS